MTPAGDGPATALAPWLVTAGMVVVAALLWFGPVSGSAPVAVPAPMPWLVIAGVFALAKILVVHYEFRRQASVLTIDEVPFVLAVVFLRPGAALLAALVGTVPVYVLYRRYPPAKLAFNVALVGLETEVTALVFRAVAHTASPVGPHGWVACLAVVGSIYLLSHGLVVTVISLANRRFDGPAVLASTAFGAISAAMSACVAVVAVAVLWVDRRGAWALIALGVAIGAGYRGYGSLRRRYGYLELLYRFTGTLSDALQGDDVVRTVLDQARTLMRAERAVLALISPGGVEHSSLSGQRSFDTGPIGPASPLERHVLTTHQPVLVPRGGGPAEVRQLLEPGVADTLAAPLPGDTGPMAVLTVSGRLGGMTTFDSEDLRLFEALANHAAVALRSSQLLRRLRQEAASKAHQALHDTLTGLANRTLFGERVTASLAGCPADAYVAVVLMDLDRFKEINDTLGHHTGDAVLRETAHRLLATVGLRGLVARLGGDEFAVVLPGVSSIPEAEAIALEICRALERPLVMDDLAVEMGVSAGVAVAPLHGDSAATLLQRADVAMYAAKAGRSGVELYAAERDHYTPRRLALAGELRRAIEEGELVLHYQPVAELATGMVTSAEALLRWLHRRHGLVPPDEFIPLAEQSGLIRPLTLWVLDTAVAQASAWQERGIDLNVSINVSARVLLDGSFVEAVAEALGRHRLPASRLTLELTESTIMADPGRSLGVLARLSATGVGLSIDDFGTGYSSLSRLRRLPVNEVKIDKSFVLSMGSDDGDEAIVRSTIDLARNLGLRVVAEGVETRRTWLRLTELGCDAAQGYFLSRPLPVAQLETRLIRRGVGFARRERWRPSVTPLRSPAEDEAEG